MNKSFKILAFLFFPHFLFSQSSKILTNKEGSEYKFTVIKEVASGPVVSQGNAGTCWSYSALSFFESEIARQGKDITNLSEMFIVYHTYLAKAERYVRMHGNITFAGGGAFHDIPYVWNKMGIVPESVYAGLNYGSEKHDHSELDAVLEGFMKALIGSDPKKLTPSWKLAVQGIIEAYLGKVPNEFTVGGKKFTPKSYAESLPINMNDYVTLSSFTHHPFYSKFILEVPDNWHWGEVYNVKLDELNNIALHALNNGYSIAWASDVSEKGFSFRDALAIVPEDESTIKVSGRDNRQFNSAGAEKKSSAFETPVKEKDITQDMRQTAFDNFETQDDHGMHITGLAKDQNGKFFYLVKNSWGQDNHLNGFLMVSEAYFKYKTTCIMLHKNAIPADIRKKLNI